MEPPLSPAQSAPQPSSWLNARIDAKTGEGKVTIFSQYAGLEIQVHEIAIHRINPDEFGFKPLDALVNWFKETFNLRTVVKIDIANSTPLYLKINDLKDSVFLLNAPMIRELQSGRTEDFLKGQEVLRKGKMQKTKEKIQKLASDRKISLDPLNQEIEKAFKEKGFEEAYQTVINLIEKAADLKAAEAELVAKAKLENKPSQTPSIEEVEAAVAAKKLNEKAKKEFFKLADDYYKPADYYPSSPAQKSQEYRNKLAYLEKLGSRVDYSVLLELLKKSENKEIMLNTYVAIGKQISEGKQEFYQKREKSQGKRISHAFRIDQKNIYIVPEAKAGAKGVVFLTEAINLNDLSTPFFREKIRAGQSESSLEEYYAGLRLGVKHHGEIREDAIELQKCLIEDAKKKESGSAFVVPINRHSVTYGKTKKYIQFAKKAEGSGAEVAKASASSQKEIFTDVARGLAYLHKNKFVHMNITPAALVAEKGPVRGKVGNVGWVMKMGQKIKWYNPTYGAPEVVKKPFKAIGIIPGQMMQDISQIKDVANASRKMDAFSFGVTIFEMITGSLPQPEDFSDGKPHFFSELKQKGIDMIFQKAKEKITSDKSLSPQDKELKLKMLDIAHQLLHRKPDDRITLEEAVEKFELL